jgi:dipeptidyl aminopeptidase/acylaminoacyl peptidase
MKKILLLTLSIMGLSASAQQTMTPELLWKLGRVSALGISKDGKNIVYKVSIPNVEENKSDSKFYTIPVNGGNATEVKEYKELLRDKYVSPDGKLFLTSKEVKVEKVNGSDFYPELEKSTVQIYNGLNYRHWDTWNDGTYNHVGYTPVDDKEKFTDIMPNEPYDSPQKPFGGEEDYTWAPDGKSIIYVAKKKAGTEYAVSTNTDLYQYDLATKKTINLTPNNPGYDTHPAFSVNGDLAWLQMKRDGYEADKNDIIVRQNGTEINLTAGWDGTVDSFTWSEDGKKIYFSAAVDGTKQLFEVGLPKNLKSAFKVSQITDGYFDVNSVVGFTKNKIIVERADMNHATEIYSYDTKTKKWDQITHVNDQLYSGIAMSKTEKRYVTTTDGKKMLVWVILPPNFDPNKRYPALLYCQGGPQSALTQFYSYRWKLPVNGCKRLYCCCTKQARYAGAWSGME